MNPDRYNSIMFRYLLIGLLLFACPLHAADETVKALIKAADGWMYSNGDGVPGK